MFLQEEIAPVPDWNDINMIIRDLRGVMDAIDDNDPANRRLRPAIARTIAMMREEKTRENQLRMARDLARQLSNFHLKDGGVLGDFQLDEVLERLTLITA
ncbi:MAG: hypothetical protein Q6373_002215 [Candidatus Sigynarchaeota archaeon]